jgi:predicted nucleic acid-binding protein
MEWLAPLRGNVIALDTAPIIYFIEGRSPYSALIRPFFEALDAGEFRAITSTLTVIEVLVHPFRAGDVALAEKYREILLQARNLSTIAVTAEIADEAARIRARYNLSTPDAIQLATATRHSATLLLTNDRELAKMTELSVMTLADVASGK